jgi:hypothetical protein
MMEIGYAINRDVIPQKPPSHRSGFPVVERIQRIWEMGDVTSSGFKSPIEALVIRLRMSNKRSNTVPRQFRDERGSTSYFRRQRHQSTISKRLSKEEIQASGAVFISSEVFDLQGATAFLTDKRSFEMYAQHSRRPGPFAQLILPLLAHKKVDGGSSFAI